ncbi:MAG: paraquat-inducible protein A [Pikeienuella sp.]
MAEDAPLSEARTRPQLIACHACDALLTEPGPGAARTRCPRCGTVLTARRAGGIDGVIAAKLASVALLVAALFLPFVNIEASGRKQQAAVLDAAAAAGGEAWPLALAVGAMIIALPLARALALFWVLTPLSLGRKPLPQARALFRLALELRPWSMVEIFVIGVVVALVKVAGLAMIDLGAGFWLFLVVALIALYEDAALCRRTVWRMLA